MGLVCDCPLDAEPNDIYIDDCPADFGQIQKGAFQRKYSSGGVLNTIPAGSGVGGIELLASWTALMAAADSTKVVPIPYVNEPTNEVGAVRTYGGGNATLGGVEINIGREPSTFNCKLLSMPQRTITDLKKYQCENIGIWLFDEFGNIGCIADDPTTPTTYQPVPIERRSLFIGDKMFGGLENPDENMMSFKLAPNWSDNFVWVKPSDFNPLDLTA